MKDLTNKIQHKLVVIVVLLFVTGWNLSAQNECQSLSNLPLIDEAAGYNVVTRHVPTIDINYKHTREMIQDLGFNARAIIQGTFTTDIIEYDSYTHIITYFQSSVCGGGVAWFGVCTNFVLCEDINQDGICDNTDQEDCNDSDNDTVCDVDDICPGFDDTIDTDEDGIPDGCDNCPNTYNPLQRDTDNDGIGNDCDCSHLLNVEIKVIDAGCQGTSGFIDIDAANNNAKILIDEIKVEAVNGHILIDKAPGSYEIHITLDEVECAFDTTVVISETSIEPVVVQVQNTTCGESDGRVVFDAPEGSLVSFNGSIDTSILVFEGLSNGFYGQAVITDANGCFQQTEPIRILCDLALQVRPNPVSQGNRVFFDLPGLPSDLTPDRVTVEVSRSMGGRPVFGPSQVDFVDSQFDISTSSWGGTGLYFVTVSANVSTSSGVAEIVRKTLKVTVQ